MTAATPSAQTVESGGLPTFSGRRRAAVWSLIVLASFAGLLAILALIGSPLPLIGRAAAWEGGLGPSARTQVRCLQA